MQPAADVYNASWNRLQWRPVWRLNFYKHVRDCNACPDARSKVLIDRIGTLDLREINFRTVRRAILPLPKTLIGASPLVSTSTQV